MRYRKDPTWGPYILVDACVALSCRVEGVDLVCWRKGVAASGDQGGAGLRDGDGY